MEYYVFATQEQAQACIDYINGTPWFPIVSKRNGVPDPTAQKTTCWCKDAAETVSGEWAVPRIPTIRLDAIGVPQEDRDAFMAVFGQDIRELTSSDFPVIEEEL
jgi:hypothetical protein